MPSLSLSASTRMAMQQKLSPQMLQAITVLQLPMDELSELVYKEAAKNPAIEIVRERTYASAGDSDRHQALLEATPDRGETLQEHLLTQLGMCRAFDAMPQNYRELARRIIENVDEHGYHRDSVESLLGKGETLGDAAAVLAVVQRFDPVGVCVRDAAESLLVQARARSDAPPSATSPSTARQLAVKLLESHSSLLETSPRATTIARKLSLSVEDVQAALDFIRTLEPFPAARFAAGGAEPSVYVVPDARVRRATEEELADGKEPFIVEMTRGTVPEIVVSRDFEELAGLGEGGHAPQAGTASPLPELVEGAGATNKAGAALGVGTTNGAGTAHGGSSASTDDGTASPLPELVEGAGAETAHNAARVRTSGAADEAVRFARTAVNDARAFMTALEQRTLTVYKALCAIVRRQRAFFEGGPRYLAPLTMKDIAEEIDVHETTVSRVARGKYVRTDWGLFEIRYFFTNSVGGASRDGGAAGSLQAVPTAPKVAPQEQIAPVSQALSTTFSAPLSKEAVKQEIRAILEEHAASGAAKPLSDQKIVDALAARRITVARRTVAKYRAELNIRSSYDR